ncbi:MAG: endonuclease MutS2 [Treponema sp.]|jgi:DNA mismatch repair protein MutS2|nr:endonuclease MutS2 [Treponema sp.]
MRSYLTKLEFDEIRRRVAECSVSVEAKAFLLEEEEETRLFDVEKAAELKQAVSIIVRRMNSVDVEPREDLPDIGGVLPKLSVSGTALYADEALAIGLFVERGGRLKHWLGMGKAQEGSEKKSKENFCTVSRFLKLDEIPDCSAIAHEVFRVVNRDGAMKDLPEFQEINRRIWRLRRELDGVVSRYTVGDEARMLQSTVPSQRDGRLVLAVKANFRGRIRGIVHEVSSTGQTIFIEPEEVVEKNNQILIETRRLDAEILRVLREMTARIAENRDILSDFHKGIIKIEILRAKARYSFETKGVFANNGREEQKKSEFVLKQALHPLLGASAVPIDFAMEDGIRAVIITGPNTGGKTVALKIAGLFALMNQWGLALPAAEGTTMPFFDSVFADIGDEQSISQSLSTFSGHIANIAKIAASATGNSLVLLDELGSGTDPEEGAALAMAILDFFIEKKVYLVVTTHHGMLKNYGYTRAGVENASMEFDIGTLSPLYRIVMGIPGESRALDIASRNGLPPAIIATARSYLNEKRSDVSALIAGLKKKQAELDEEATARESETVRLAEERREIALKELCLKQKEAILAESGLVALKKLLEKSRKTLENLVRELKEGEISREKTLKVKEFLRDFENSVSEATEYKEKSVEEVNSFKQEVEKREKKSKIDLEAGTEVLIGDHGQRGKIVRQEKNGSFLVEIGSVKLTFSADALVPTDYPFKPQKPAVLTDLAAESEARLEVNLLGLRLEEALSTLRRQIDGAILSGLEHFAVVHGKGNGILRQGIHEFLKSEPLVANFHFSRPEFGGAGRTEVEMKV